MQLNGADPSALLFTAITTGWPANAYRTASSASASRVSGSSSTSLSNGSYFAFACS
jgi:hypothetical protein